VVDENLSRGQEAIEVHLLRRDPNQYARLEVGRGVVAEDGGVAAPDPDEARDRLDQRRLAGAVRSKQAEERARWDPKI
jgi:hypothetical protein